MKKNAIKNSEISAIQKVLNMDYYKNDNRDIFQNLLRKIKPFKNYPVENDLPLDLLEKLIHKYECKYAIMINYICPVFIKDEKPMYSATVKDVETLQIMQTIHSSTIYELFCKLALFYYMVCNVEQKVGLKDWSKK